MLKPKEKIMVFLVNFHKKIFQAYLFKLVIANKNVISFGTILLVKA